MAMKYLFPSSMPYDDLTFIDQSAYTETTPLEEIATIPDGPIAFIPFVSPRGYGEDNKLMYMDSSRLAKYGNPNLKKYGLSLYLANRFIEGGGTLLGMRMMPKDAGYANKCIYAVIKKTDIISYETETIGRYPNETDIKKALWQVKDSDTTISSSLLLTDSYELFNADGKKVDTSFSSSKNLLDEDIQDKSYDIKFGDETKKVYVLKDENDKLGLYSDANGTGTGVLEASLVATERVSIKYKGMTVNAKDQKGNFTDFELESSIKTIKEYNDAPKGTEVTVPLFVFRSKAKGDFAKSFKFKLTADETMNAQYPSRFFYKFSSDENGAKLDGDMTFTLDDDFIYGDDALGVADVFDKYAANMAMFKSKSFDLFKSIMESILEASAATNGLTAEDCFYSSDIIFGTKTYNSFVVDLDVDVKGNEQTNLSKFDLNNLSGADLDGSIATADFTAFGNSEGFTDPFADMFAEVYGADVQNSGIYTDLIYDEVRFPFEYIIVPSYDKGVMDAAYDLAKNRHITRVFFTYPKCDTYAEARQWATSNMSAYNEFISSEYCEWWQIKDPYTKKNTMMPSTYFNAYGLPYHWLHNKGVPYAGTRNYRWSGGKVGTMTPCSVNPNEYIANHNVGLNTMIEDGLGYASPYEQITSQQKRITSQLSELNNATILMNMARIALKMSSDARWTTLSDEEVNTFISNVETAISLGLNGTYRSLRIEGERESVNGAGRNRIHCKFYVNFNDMLKGVTYEFYILAN